MRTRTEEEKRAARRATHLVGSHMLEWGPFEHRGFSKRTIEAVIACGIDAPERLLFMTEDELRSIPGVGKVSLAEIMRYRVRFKR
jgi:DNA-directed RNA polymerase alpha subunit